ncbi:MAG: T9SS C-terminal target domain-containing protein [Cytophagia bacterium]|nr:MAG: T9SS C-terminal target domain-containing protein [Cytophagia bacterium]TAG38504.1 MAG: T9SS C-terminal target domain-containing protein [Cytophagia bacterium]
MTDLFIYSKQPFKKFIGLCCFLFLFAFVTSAQNAIVGTGFSSGWGGGSCPTGNLNFKPMAANISTTYSVTSQANGTGNQFWRFGIDWSTTTAQRTNNIGSDVDVVVGTKYTLNSSCTTSGSLRYNVPNASYNYVFKTLDAGTNPTGAWVFFEVQGDVRTVLTVNQSLSVVYRNQSPVITANLSGNLNTGQSVYLRYTTNTFPTSSTVVEMSGTGLTRTANIPAFSGGTNVQYYIFTSGSGLQTYLAANPTDSDLYTINHNNNGGSNYSYTVNNSIVSTTDGNWSDASIWVGGVVPISTDNVTIANNVTLNQNASVSNITINVGRTLTSQASSARVLTVSGVFTNNGTPGSSFIANDGKVVFAAGSSISGSDIGFNNVDVNAINMNFSNQNVYGVLTINTGGSISNAPIYGAASTLAYSTGLYTVGNEWSQNETSGVGIPNDVLINAGSINFGATTQFRYLSGNLTISGSTSLTLSSNSGGDLRIEGNFTNNGTFNANGRAVFFVGSGADQTITGVTTFPFMIIDKVNSNVVLNDNISVSNTMTLTNGGLDLNGKNLTFSGSSIVFDGTATKSITSTTASIFDINTSNTAITRSTGSNKIAFGSNITLRTNRGVNFGSGLTDINGIFQIESGGFANTNTPNYQSGSTLRYNSGTVYGRSVEWSTNSPFNVELANNTTLDLGANGGTGTARTVVNTLTVGLGSTFSMNQAGNQMTATLTVGSLVNNGTFLMSGVATNNNDLVCQGNITNTGTFTTNNQNISIQGNWTNDGTFNAGIDPNAFDMITFARVSFNNAATLQTIGGLSTTNFYDLTVNKTAGKVRLLRNIGVTFLVNMLALANVALLDLNGNNIDCGSTGNVVESPSLAQSYVTDESAAGESARGGAIIMSGRTINTGATVIGGISLARTAGTDYTVTVTRRHYRGAGIGLKRIFQVDVTSGNASGTNTTVVYGYSDGDLSGLTESTLLQGKWSTGIGWVTYPAGMGALESNLNVTNNTITVLGYDSFSSVTGTSSNNAALPVSLTKFEGQSINKTQARLTWQTATEINNKQFEVEKSIDGVSFEKIATIDGNGNSSVIRNYQTIDNNFIASAYYRLRQIDFNGTESMSQVIFIKNNNDKILVYPNPTSGEIFIQSNENKQSNLNWKLIDAQGKVILNGNDTLENVEKALSNQLRNQNKGMYMIEIQGSKEIYRQKLVVE